jgi:hypothetical protein
MLHAVNGGKARLRGEGSDGGRTPIEDIVTSTVFGPLDYMNNDDRRELLRSLLEHMHIPQLSDHVPQLHFWVKRPTTTFRERSVEPDLVINFGPVSKLVVEVKWGAALSARELAAQWASLSSQEQGGSRHLILTRDPPRYRDHIADDREALRVHGVSNWQLHECSWREFARILRTLALLPRLSSQVKAWATDAAAFLAREEFRVMVGWSNLGLWPVPLVESSAWRRKFLGSRLWQRTLAVRETGWHFSTRG